MSRRASLSRAAAAVVFCGLLAGLDVRPAAAQDPLAPLDEIQEARDPLAPESTPEEPGSPSVEQVTQWVGSTGDNNGRPFIVIDKITPYDLWKELIENRNQPLATVVAAFCLAIAIIVAAAIH